MQGRSFQFRISNHQHRTSSITLRNPVNRLKTARRFVALTRTSLIITIVIFTQQLPFPYEFYANSIPLGNLISK